MEGVIWDVSIAVNIFYYIHVLIKSMYFQHYCCSEFHNYTISIEFLLVYYQTNKCAITSKNGC